MTTQAVDGLGSLKWLANQGASFCLPRGRTKGTDPKTNKPTFEKGWQNTPYRLEDAHAHVKRAGNVGILTGEHSSNIVALDRDIDFPATVLKLGQWGETAKIIRDNAPERGKFLYRVNGTLPSTTAWKPPGEEHPQAEMLANGRHALGPTSEFDGGHYILQDADLGIMEVTPAELDYIWWLITGEHLYPEFKPNDQVYGDSKEYVAKVKDAWPTIEVFKHFGKDAEGISERHNRTHIRGNAGLFVDNWRWFCHGSHLGGDQLDAWSYCKTDKVIDRNDKKAFWDVVNEMADVAGIPRPKVFTNGQSRASATATAQSTKPKPGASTTANMLDALELLGYSFRQNLLDDSIEVNGQTISDGVAAEIRCAMRDKGFAGMEAVKDAYTMNAYHNRYHPIKDYFAGLVWDGKDHIANLAAHFASDDAPIFYKDGSKRTVIHAFLIRFLVGAAAKVYQQAQNIMLTLAGPQGIGKSTVPAWLCSPLPDFFNESQLDPDGKETDRRLAKTFLWEIGELGATTRRADVNALKNKLTQSHVTFRVPYGHYDVTKPVLTSFIGTVNPDGRGFLVDKTGNRRFAVVNVKSIQFDYYTNIDPSQVWAQAYALYQSGEPWRLLPEEQTTQAEINEKHQSEETIDMLMPQLFYIDRDNDSLQIAPVDIANELFYKNYAKDLDRCAKDAAAWLKMNGHVKKGKPPTWRGIRRRMPHDPW